jgi:tetratricopeptide (TPR) repeat protein
MDRHRDLPGDLQVSVGCRRSPGYSSAHNWRSEILFVLGRTDESLAEVRKAIELDPLTPFPRFFLGLVLEVKDDAADAEKAYRDAIASDPAFPMTQLYVQMGRGSLHVAV